MGYYQGVCTLWYPGISIGDITRYIPWYYRYCWYSMNSILVLYSLTYPYYPQYTTQGEEGYYPGVGGISLGGTGNQ